MIYTMKVETKLGLPVALLEKKAIEQMVSVLCTRGDIKKNVTIVSEEPYLLTDKTAFTGQIAILEVEEYKELKEKARLFDESFKKTTDLKK